MIRGKCPGEILPVDSGGGICDVGRVPERPDYNFGRRILHWWAIATALVTFVLLWSGGLVTSKGAGMAVPDWPSTFGYNMFLFPFSKWVGGIFYEHSHRLLGSLVGVMVIGLVAAAFILDNRRWIKVYASILLVAVIAQGVLGGLRVVLVKDEIGIFHAALAQSFFSAMCVFCVATSRAFVEKRWADFEPDRGLRLAVFAATGVIFLQLVLGATMRHEHIGLAVPDFPLAYGKVLPDTGVGAMAEINAARRTAGDVPITAHHVWVHMAHRAVACIICAALFAVFLKARHSSRRLRGMAAVWLAMVLVQFALGAWTVWSNKAADVATTHMALGAILLAWGVVFSFRLKLGSRAGDFALPDPKDIRPEAIA